ncbi:MAG: hypothetical protein PHT13_14640 [Methanosarcina sp.]|nr:hypothetical protein [Methanosarcina sp.]
MLPFLPSYLVSVPQVYRITVRLKALGSISYKPSKIHARYPLEMCWSDIKVNL